MHTASKSEINCFLKQYRKGMFLPQRFHLLDRTMDGITDLGLTIPQVKQIIKGVRYNNYDRGPTPDHNGDGLDIWEFGIPFEGILIYIKLKIDPEYGYKCLSFKKSSGPWTLPYKNW
ncbi:type II toxin-antitoxin system MqsR family toxin [Peribacillus simplex]|uniref:type II toxin-antitoxin system MqsR family toxin n=1 Tax=Peribacillus simplex TaxID=1478 RepID=UPI0011DDD071|nr:type II toxin-antitoxin system MqsR family toxin [Peribacillus simplex]